MVNLRKDEMKTRIALHHISFRRRPRRSRNLSLSAFRGLEPVPSFEFSSRFVSLATSPAQTVPPQISTKKVAFPRLPLLLTPTFLLEFDHSKRPVHPCSL